MLKKMSVPLHDPHYLFHNQNCSIQAPLMFLTIIYTGFLLIQGNNQEFGLWVLFAAQAAGIITNWVNRRAEAKALDKKHEWEREERREIAAQQAALMAQQSSLNAEMARNTAITVKAAAKADDAYHAANNVNEKIALIGVAIAAGSELAASESSPNP